MAMVEVSGSMDVHIPRSLVRGDTGKIRNPGNDLAKQTNPNTSRVMMRPERAQFH
jgi:hypothetical protein